jgi:hypothetical protein
VSMGTMRLKYIYHCVRIRERDGESKKFLEGSMLFGEVLRHLQKRLIGKSGVELRSPSRDDWTGLPTGQPKSQKHS